MRNAVATSSAIEVPEPPAPAGWRGQFARPSGVLGRVVGYFMAITNKQRSWWVLPLLDIHQNDRVLEVGFGSGIDIQRVSEMAIDGFVAGVDHSPVMVEHARRRNAAAIRKGLAEVSLGSASQLPFPDESFDKIFSINVAQFWPDAVSPMREMRRVLRIGGVVAIAVQPRSQGPAERAARETARSLVENLRRAGFSDVRLESKRMKPAATVCAVAVK